MDEKTAFTATVAVASLNFAGVLQVVIAVLLALLLWKYLLHPAISMTKNSFSTFWSEVEQEADKIQKEKGEK